MQTVDISYAASACFTNKEPLSFRVEIRLSLSLLIVCRDAPECRWAASNHNMPPSWLVTSQG